MYEKLLKTLNRPILWQRSEGPFWDDEHISKGMLAAHLDPNHDAASRRPDFIDRSAGWIASLVPNGGKLLDLGCGPGLYCTRFSTAGLKVTGLDCSRRSIAYAKEHDDKTEYILGDYLATDFGVGFDAITMIYCDYAALTKPERMLVLAKIRRALNEDGVFVFDVFTPISRAGKTETTEWAVQAKGGFWSAEPHACFEARYYYENGSVEASQSVIVTEREVKDYIIWDTVFTAKELSDELSAAGLKLDAVYGDASGSALTSDSPTICAVARRA